MTETWVIHWAGKSYTGLTSVIGSLARAIREIESGDSFTADEITRVECYDSEEGWAKVVPLYEVAEALADDYERCGCDPVSIHVKEFIEREGGFMLARGIRVRDKSFSAG